ncbi:MAG: metal ABC transporter substrate-binding protein [Flaviflexus sp.]|nr:metal ABC transporter substrate-binding protein [Flaviflexus sp.]
MRSRILLTLALSSAVLTACSAEPDSTKIEVTTSFYPLQYAVQQIGGDRVEVASLTPPGSDAHHLELSPRQVTALAETDLVVYLSGFQPAMDEAVAEASPTHVVDAADIASSDPALDGNPHFWVDPRLMAELASPIVRELTEIDPDHADEYAERAEEYERTLTDLDEGFRSGLASCERDTLIVTHAAFGYLAHSYGLTQEAIAGVEPDTEPSPARIASVTELIRDSGVTTVFATSKPEVAMAQALAGEADVEVKLLDALESQLDPERDYAQVMADNLALLRESLGCK